MTQPDPSQNPGFPASPSCETGSLGVARRRWRIRVAFGLVLAAAGLIYAFGWQRFVTLEAFLAHREVIMGFVGSRPLAAMLAYAGLYVGVIAAAIPGGLLLTLLGGLLFGGWLGGGITVIAATIGALIAFWLARALFQDRIAPRLGRHAPRLIQGFNANAASFMLFLRLVPLFPFTLVNIAPALSQIRTTTFLWTTIVGIVPGTFAFAFIGAGLGKVVELEAVHFQACRVQGLVDCKASLSPSALIAPELLLALVGLGILALTPILAKRIFSRYQDMRMRDPQI